MVIYLSMTEYPLVRRVMDGVVLLIDRFLEHKVRALTERSRRDCIGDRYFVFGAVDRLGDCPGVVVVLRDVRHVVVLDFLDIVVVVRDRIADGHIGSASIFVDDRLIGCINGFILDHVADIAAHVYRLGEGRAVVSGDRSRECAILTDRNAVFVEACDVFICDGRRFAALGDRPGLVIVVDDVFCDVRYVSLLDVGDIFLQIGDLVRVVGDIRCVLIDRFCDRCFRSVNGNRRVLCIVRNGIIYERIDAYRIGLGGAVAAFYRCRNDTCSVDRRRHTIDSRVRIGIKIGEINGRFCAAAVCECEAVTVGALCNTNGVDLFV